MKKFDFVTLDGVTVTINVNPAGFVQLTALGKSRSIALPRFARTLHANPSAVRAEPLEGAVRLVLADGSAWIVFADTLHIAEEPRSVTEEFEEQERQIIAASAQPQESENGSSQPIEHKEEKLKVGSRKAAFFEALAKVLASRGLAQDEIQSIIAQLSATRRDGVHRQIDTSTPEGKILAAMRQLFSFLKRHFVRYESKSEVLSILFDGHKVTLYLPDGSSIAYPQ